MKLPVPFKENITDRQTDQPTDRPGQREVSLPIKYNKIIITVGQQPKLKGPLGMIDVMCRGGPQYLSKFLVFDPDTKLELWLLCFCLAVK